MHVCGRSADNSVQNADGELDRAGGGESLEGMDETARTQPMNVHTRRRLLASTDTALLDLRP
jgi:hypothetical protein